MTTVVDIRRQKVNVSRRNYHSLSQGPHKHKLRQHNAEFFKAKTITVHTVVTTEVETFGRLTSAPDNGRKCITV